MLLHAANHSLTLGRLDWSLTPDDGAAHYPGSVPGLVMPGKQTVTVSARSGAFGFQDCLSPGECDQLAAALVAVAARQRELNARAQA